MPPITLLRVCLAVRVGHEIDDFAWLGVVTGCISLHQALSWIFCSRRLATFTMWEMLPVPMVCDATPHR